MYGTLKNVKFYFKEDIGAVSIMCVDSNDKLIYFVIRCIYLNNITLAGFIIEINNNLM
jgi:hypothetical protein